MGCQQFGFCLLFVFLGILIGYFFGLNEISKYVDDGKPIPNPQGYFIIVYVCSVTLGFIWFVFMIIRCVYIERKNQRVIPHINDETIEITKQIINKIEIQKIQNKQLENNSETTDISNFTKTVEIV